MHTYAGEDDCVTFPLENRDLPVTTSSYQSKSISWNFFGIDDDLSAFLLESNLRKAIVNSRAFKRLADIRFLGAIDYFIRPTGGSSRIKRHNRQQHTLGVTRLAMIFCEELEIDGRRRDLVAAAALLHDIGHAPLSHSMEPLFSKFFNLNHHKAAIEIIWGRDPARLGSEIRSALTEAGLNLEEVALLISGKHQDATLNRIFAHPINIDTIEAIVRCKSYASTLHQMHSPKNILLDLVSNVSGGALLDDFWYLKNSIYTVFINGALGVYADSIAQNYFLTNVKAMAVDDFFRSERAFRSRHKALFQDLEKARLRLAKHREALFSGDSQITEFTKRQFYIDPQYGSGEPKRYVQSKIISCLSLNQLIDSARIDLENLDVKLTLL